MDKQSLIQRLLTTFLVEFEERLQSMSRELLALETCEAYSPEQERQLQSLMRNAHSLKGAARAVDIELIEQSCHRLEEILSGVQKDRTLLDPTLLHLLFTALDGLAEAGKRLRSGQSLEGALLWGVSRELELFANTCVHKLVPAVAAPLVEAGMGLPPSALVPGLPMETLTESSLPAAHETLSVRIDTEKLDLLLSHSGELSGARQRLRTTASRLGALGEALSQLQTDWRRAKERLATAEPERPLAPPKLPRRLQELCEQTPLRLLALQAELDQARLSFNEDWRLLDQVCLSVDEQIRRIRMLPFVQCCIGFDRMVRDLARAAGKEAELHVEGGDVEIDRSVLEALKDPLRHLIRNAIDHGIENRKSGSGWESRCAVASRPPHRCAGARCKCSWPMMDKAWPWRRSAGGLRR
jgi:two-component system chemotaxis sensor kinase CheA